MELKPCPFCGGEDVVYFTFDGEISIFCTNCFAKSGSKKTKEEVIEAWDRRAVCYGNCKMKSKYCPTCGAKMDLEDSAGILRGEVDDD